MIGEAVGSEHKLREGKPEFEMFGQPKRKHPRNPKTTRIGRIHIQNAVTLQKFRMSTNLEMRIKIHKSDAYIVSFAVMIRQIQIISQLGGGAQTRQQDSTEYDPEKNSPSFVKPK